MHSRIIELNQESKRKKLTPELIENYEPWFLKSIADYVRVSEFRDDDVKWFKELLNGNLLYSGMLKVDEESIKKYFTSKYKAFHHCAVNLKQMTFEQFINGSNGDMNVLNENYIDRYGFYIYDSDVDNLETLDEYLRVNQYGFRAYIGNILDYHW